MIEIRKYFSLIDTRCCSVGAASRIFVPSTATLKVARKRYHHLFNESISDISENQQNLENSNYLDEYLFFEYHQIVTKVLNRLETLSMMMVQKVADEKAIYNSFSDFFWISLQDFITILPPSILIWLMQIKKWKMSLRYSINGSAGQNGEKNGKLSILIIGNVNPSSKQSRSKG